MKKIRMQSIENFKVVLSKEFYTVNWVLGGGGGCSVDVGLLSENHHKYNLIAGEDLLLNKDVVLLLWITSYIGILNM